MEAQNFKVSDKIIYPNSRTLLVDVDLKLKKEGHDSSSMVPNNEHSYFPLTKISQLSFLKQVQILLYRKYSQAIYENDEVCIFAEILPGFIIDPIGLIKRNQ